MTRSVDNKVVETHGCIVCARPYNILVIYDMHDRLVDFNVTSPGGHRVPGGQQALVACNTHTAEEIEIAFQRWQSKNGRDAENEQEDE